ncbi:hypothetical protein Cgig2_017476 [Carnegiea gigantea]|uniref:Uncharacterized protein n=1 Tax=Carnegiea gigantea TaxID=171969 RepID=A0A9Q1GNL9_9CARY|nr:hypothetical protein Cgig2_017476 [Carnegiea gigantea]
MSRERESEIEGERLKEKRKGCEIEDDGLGLQSLCSLQREKPTVERESESGRSGYNRKKSTASTTARSRTPKQCEEGSNNTEGGSTKVQFEESCSNFKNVLKWCCVVGGNKCVHLMAIETSAWTSEESNPDYCNSQEGGSAHSGSQSYVVEEVSSSNTEHLKGGCAQRTVMI